jgi:hypothetical protein
VAGPLADWQRNDFFFSVWGFPDEEMVGDHETRQPGGEFEINTGSVQGKDHERCRSLFHQPLACWRITGSVVGVNQVLNVGTGRRPRNG